MKYFKFTILLFIGFIITFGACRKEESFITDSSAKLSFSTDTLRFDTVFTETGSATRYFKVFNKNEKPIKISKITLNNKSGVIFNLNIDGISAKNFSDVEIAANDSIYVFAEVTVNPNAPLSTSPFVVDQELIFETNGNSQKVILEAWGQNANYIPNRFAKGGFAVLSGGDPSRVITWDDPKPYVVYGVLFVDSCTLKLAAGTRIHVHGGLSYLPDTSVYRDGIIYVLPNGRIVSEGTLEKPVVITGDRLEKEFENEPDQWAGVILGERSKGNSFTHTIIRNSAVGVRVDSAANLTMKNCKVYNTAGSGLITSHATVKAENCLFYGNGGSCALLGFGGDYELSYCTLSSIGSREPALSANNIKCYELNAIGGCSKGLAYPLSMKATNCIFYGSKDDEISFLNGTTNASFFNYDFKNNIVRVKDLLKTDNTPDFLTKCKDCIRADGKSKVFKKPSEANYRLDTLSVAEMKALPLSNILNDIDGKSRDVKAPDIGCYEYQYK